MPSYCACGKLMDAERPQGFRQTRRPCLCDEPAAYEPRALNGEKVIMRGDHPRDPARARLGLPDRTPLEKAVLRGTFNE